MVFDANAGARGAEGRCSADREELAKALAEKPRAVWVMLPAGRITEETIEHLGGLLEPDDDIIDGGNSFQDDIRRAKVAEKRIRYVGAGRPEASGASARLLHDDRRPKGGVGSSRS